MSGGPLVVIFAVTMIKDKNEFRATLSMMWLILNSIILAMGIGDGFFTPHVWMIGGIAIFISLLSLFIARLLLKIIDTKHFMKIAYVLLFISGVFAVL